MMDSSCEHPGCQNFCCYGIGPPLLPKDRWWCTVHRKEMDEEYWRLRNGETNRGSGGLAQSS